MKDGILAAEISAKSFDIPGSAGVAGIRQWVFASARLKGRAGDGDATDGLAEIRYTGGMVERRNYPPFWIGFVIGLVAMTVYLALAR